MRAEIADIHRATAKRLARKVLKMSSASEIRALVEERYESRGTLKHLQTAKA